MDDGGDVVGVSEPACRDEAWEQGLDVVVIGFGAAEFGLTSTCSLGLGVFVLVRGLR